MLRGERVSNVQNLPFNLQKKRILIFLNQSIKQVYLLTSYKTWLFKKLGHHWRMPRSILYDVNK